MILCTGRLCVQPSIQPTTNGMKTATTTMTGMRMSTSPCMFRVAWLYCKGTGHKHDGASQLCASECVRSVVTVAAYPGEHQQQGKGKHAQQNGGHECQEHVGHESAAEAAAGGSKPVTLLVRPAVEHVSASAQRDFHPNTTPPVLSPHVHRRRHFVQDEVQLVQEPGSVHHLHGEGVVTRARVCLGGNGGGGWRRSAPDTDQTAPAPNSRSGKGSTAPGLPTGTTRRGT